MEIIDYMLIEKFSADGLSLEIFKRIDSGWQPWGFPYHCRIEDDGMTAHYQAIVKYGEE